MSLSGGSVQGPSIIAERGEYSDVSMGFCLHECFRKKKNKKSNKNKKKRMIISC